MGSNSESEHIRFTQSSDSDDSEDFTPVKKRKRLEWMRGGPIPQHLLKSMIANLEDEASETTSDSNASGDESMECFQQEEVNDQQNLQPTNDGSPVNYSSAGSTSLTSSVPSSSDSSCSRDSDSSSQYGNLSTSCESDTEENIPMSEPLYEGAKISKGQAVSLLLDLSCRHAASKALISDLVTYTCKLLPRNNTFPKTMYFFEQDIQPFIPPDSSVIHYCCEACGSYLESGDKMRSECDVCKAQGKDTQLKYFYEFPLAGQLKYLFEERKLADAIDSYAQKVGDICDITKGDEYLRVKSNLTGKYDVVLLSSADGLSPHKNSEQEVWTLTFTLCEVPPELRKVFVMVSQIWYGKKKPPMNAFMIPFVRSLQNLYVNGVEWCHPRTKAVHVSKGTGPVFTLDAPARAMVQNIILHSGFFSCSICEIEGEYIFCGKGGKTVFPNEDVMVLRSKESMQLQTNSLLENGIIVKGVKGVSQLSCIPLCDRSTAIVYEYMHLVLLGVTRQFFSKWFGEMKAKGEKNSKKQPSRKYPWYIGNKSTEINNFLKQLKSTYELTRFPKDVKKYKTFKASTWLVWLLYVSVPVLHCHLPEEYSQHWLLLVSAIHCLLQEVIHENDIEMASLLLTAFVEESETLNGKDIMSYNVHGLKHLALIVKRWGGLWCNSTFLFEDYNGVITRNIHGTVLISEEFVNVLGRHMANQTLKNVLCVDDAHFTSAPLLKGKPLHHSLSEEECVLLREISPDASDKITIFARVQLGKTMYTSLSYCGENVSDNKTVVFLSSDNTKVFGILKYFFETAGEVLAFVKALDVDNDLRFRHHETGIFVRHILPVHETEDICIVPVTKIVSKVIRVGDYVCVPPNKFECSL